MIIIFGKIDVPDVDSEMGISNKNLFFLFIVLILMGSKPVYGVVQVETILATIPAEDRQDLERLFYCLFIRDGFCYGAFDGKAVCLSGHFTLTPYENWIEGCTGGGSFWKQWGVWERYKAYFPMENYLLIKEPGMIDNNELIILINKNLFVDTVINNQHVFEKILKTKIDPHQLLEDLERGVKSLKTSINNNNVLWAVLLGYGIHNGLFYVHRGKILKSNCLKGFADEEFSLQRVEAISFMCDPHHAESQKLKLKYDLLRNHLSRIYSKGSLLQVSLSQLTE